MALIRSKINDREALELLDLNADNLSAAETRAVLDAVERVQKTQHLSDCRNSFLSFAKHVWPQFICGPHHKIMAEAFEKMVFGKSKRLILNVPPRFGKSYLTSWLLPCWLLGRKPSLKIMAASHTAQFAESWGRKVRDLIKEDKYREIFPNIALKADTTAAGRWSTRQDGEYFAVGVGGSATGRGADLLLLDDVHALEINTPIATPNGFVKLIDLRVGDYVFGPDGEKTRVTGKSKIFHDRELFSVKTSDGEEVLCDKDHKWTYSSGRDNRPYITKYTKEIIDLKKILIPHWNAVEYPERELLIDPWVLGSWLGDGTSSKALITCDPSDREYMISEFNKAGYQTNDVTDKFNFSVIGLWPQLKKLGLLDNKHIPEEYLTSSIEQRMSLLQGLMDTDGNVTTFGQCAFHNKNLVLITQVKELLHSLGIKAKLNKYIVKGYAVCEIYRLCFSIKDAARMPRKAKNTRNPKYNRRRNIKITNSGLIGDVQCITVERPDGLFLVGRGYIVTHNSEEAGIAPTPDYFQKVYEWYTSGPRQRLHPGGKICVIQTRWAPNDLTGMILDNARSRNALEQWEVIELPAILPNGESLWPEFWPIEDLEALKAELPVQKWESQYMQRPSSEGAAIVKREWWNVWEQERAPQCDYIIMSLDTAYSSKEVSDFSCFTVWGVFEHDDPKTGKTKNNIMLLDVRNERVDFPVLKQMALDLYKEWKPDSFVIEAKAAGKPLADELQALGIPLQTYTPTRISGDKITRLSAISDVFASRLVWYPRKRWAEELVEQVATFPMAAHDDMVDSMTMAIRRFRDGNLISLPTDFDDSDEERPIRKRKEPYY